ncbi:hypothetical protein BASA81_010413 [Batrachochytrium salamandrivorans]|nr:hypothetical protein BASA81_010413 [Batrachochytrium salamandrivorans]
MEHVSKIDRRTTKHGARFRITVPEDRQRNIIQRLERQSKQTHWRIRQNYRHRRPDQTRPTAPPPPLSRQILAVNVANISNKRPAIRHIVRNTRLWAISETCITSSKFRFTVPGFDVIQHPATGPGRRGIALGIPSCFGGHEHGSAVGTMILAKRLQRIVHSWGHGLTVMQFSGSQITRLSTVHGRRHSSIDHFVCNAPARALLTSPRVDRQTAVADHFVIQHIHSSRGSRTTPCSSCSNHITTSLSRSNRSIATSNYWDVLADGATDNTDTDTDTNIHQLTSQFLESANAVADNLSLRLSPPATRSNRRLLSGTTKRAILASNTARQAFIAAATHTNPDPVQCNTLRDEWSRLKAAATQLERVDGPQTMGQARGQSRPRCIRRSNRSRICCCTCHVWKQFPQCCSHSTVQLRWHSTVRPNIDPACHARNSDILDQDFSWNQIAAALLQMSPRKAPGDDGITTAFYQAALYMPANTQEGVPPTPFARALLRVCGQVFASATIPRAWLCASIVSIDKKDGDPLNPGDKRGIALINVGLKLVCKVLQMRIERFVETNNLLSYEQAGFRKREECVGQVVSLVDIIQRRQNAGLNTHVLFIDIRKGIRYSPRWCTVMEAAEHGIPSSYSCLSQGISLDYRETRTPSEDSCTQTMWQSLLTLSNHCWLRRLLVEQWANQWEMQFGVAKCGIISFTGHLAPRLDNPLDIRLHGQLVSRVESYKYLGVLIDSKLDHSAWLKQKRSALEHTISALHPVLANHQLTVNYRSRIFSACGHGQSLLWARAGWWQQVTPCTTTDNDQQGYPTVHWCPTLDCHWTPSG